MTPSEELELRKRQLRARDGKTGYKVNCEALRARIAVLEIGLALPKVEEALGEQKQSYDDTFSAFDAVEGMLNAATPR